MSTLSTPKLMQVGVLKQAVIASSTKTWTHFTSRNHLHSKQCWVAWTQIWVKYGQTQILG